jgi:exonuclease III
MGGGRLRQGAILAQRGVFDSFPVRIITPSPDRFTWWVQWANARERNIGWRIDTKSLA